MKNHIYRLEESQDYGAVEAMTRDAFWNVYKPGCDEHYILHTLRYSQSVIEELNYICVDISGRLLGHIFYTHSSVISEDGTVFPVISFGPISVRPDSQGQGIGSTLIQMTLKKAAALGFPGALITGSPAYYRRFGFREAKDFDIVYEDGTSFPELMACELGQNLLRPVHGRVHFCPEFGAVDQELLQHFDAQFPPREKLRLPGQLT